MIGANQVCPNKRKYCERYRSKYQKPSQKPGAPRQYGCGTTISGLSFVYHLRDRTIRPPFFPPRFSEQIYFLSLNIICSEIEACRIPRLLAGGFRSKSVRELTLKNMIKLVGTYVTNRIRPRFSEWWKGISRSKMLSSSTFYRQVHRWVTYRNGCHARTIPPPLHLSCVMMTSWNRAGGHWRSRRHHGSQRWHKYGYCTFLQRKTII